MGQVFVYREGLGVIPIQEAPPLGYDARPNLGVITDEMPPTVNHADGNIYTSKHEFRRATRRAGCYEVGNETPNTKSYQNKQYTPEGLRETILDSVRKYNG